MTRPKKPVKADELGRRLGGEIAKYRKGRGLTQAALAEMIGVDSETISRFERGTALPSLLRLFELARALHVGVGHLLTEADALVTEGAEHGILVGVPQADQKLLLQIAELMRKR